MTRSDLTSEDVRALLAQGEHLRYCPAYSDPEKECCCGLPEHRPALEERLRVEGSSDEITRRIIEEWYKGGRRDRQGPLTTAKF